jgi:hypothetical protein
MKKQTLIALFVLAGLAVQAAEVIRFDGKPGSKMRIEGTSNIHDWQVEGNIIGGYLEVSANFPTEPGATVTPGKVEAKADAFIPVRSLKSVEKDGKPYNDKMDDIMYGKLQPEPKFARITFHLTELTLKEAAKDKDSPYLFDAKGELVVAGITNTVAMPVTILPQADKKLKVSGTVSIKMSDYKIEPPAPKIAMGLIKTGDPVKLIFDWQLAQRVAK